MNKFRLFIVVVASMMAVFFSGGAVGSLEGCRPLTPQETRTALDIGRMACVIVNAAVEDDHQLAQLCDIAEPFLPEMRKVRSAQKQAAKMMTSSSDAGCASHD
jgi:hypothetical protein